MSRRARNSQPQPARRRWAGTAVLGSAVLAVSAVSAMSPAANAVPGTTVLDPTVEIGVSVPGGAVWIGDHVWVADHLQGLCRLDVDGAGVGSINQSTCLDGLDGQPSVAPDGVSVYSTSRAGVHALTFDAGTQTLSDNGTLAGTDTVDFTELRPVATAVDGNGTLHIGTIRSADLYAYDASGPAPGPVDVGDTSDGGGIASLAAVGTDLFLAEETGLSTIAAPSTATPTLGATVLPGLVTAPLGLTADPVSRKLYVTETPKEQSFVVRHDIDTGAEDVFADIDPPGTTDPAATSGTAMYFASGLAVDSSTGDLYVADDPGLVGGAELPFEGRVFQVPAAHLAVADGTTIPAPPGAVVASLVADRATAPEGIVKVGNRTWIADHVQGICRLANGRVLGSSCVALNGGGQLAYKAPYLYVAEGGSKGRGVVRLRYDSATGTFGSPLVLRNQVDATGQSLAGARIGSLVQGVDGHLYLGGLRGDEVYRLTDPHKGRSAQTLSVIGRTSDGGGVSNLAVQGRALWVAEGAAVTRIQKATFTASGGGNGVCAGACVASLPAVPVDVVAPTALVSQSGQLYVADTPTAASTVVRYTVRTGVQQVWASAGRTSPTATPDTLTNVSALIIGARATATNPGQLLIGDDPTAGDLVANGRIWAASLTP